MADNVTLPGTGAVIATDEAVDGTLGTVQFQFVKVADGALGSTNKLGVDSSGRITALIQGVQSALTTGTITSATSTVTNTGASNYNVATVGITGTYNGVTFVFEGSPDGTNWFTLQGQRTDTGVAESGGAALTNVTRAWDVAIGAWAQFRVRATAWTSGTATVLIMMQTMAVEPVPTAVQGPPGTTANRWPVQLTDGTTLGGMDTAGGAYVTFARPATATPTNVNSSATNVNLLASNSNAKVRTVFNDSTAILYLKFGATASATSYTVQIPPGGYYEFPQPLYTGAVDGIWSAANGAARLTEVT